MAQPNPTNYLSDLATKNLQNSLALHKVATDISYTYAEQALAISAQQLEGNQFFLPQGSSTFAQKIKCPFLTEFLINHHEQQIHDCKVSSDPHSEESCNKAKSNNDGNNSESSICKLLSYGADVNAWAEEPLHHFYSPFFVTKSAFFPDTTTTTNVASKSLVEASGDVNVKPDGLWVPLVHTTNEWNVKRNAVTRVQNTVQSCHQHVMGMLVDNGQSVNCVHQFGGVIRPLHLSAVEGHAQIIQNILMTCGFDTNLLCDLMELVPLHWTREHEDVLHGQDGWKSLRNGLAEGIVASRTVADILINYCGSAVNDLGKLDCESFSPLHISLRFGIFHPVNVLFMNGARVNSKFDSVNDYCDGNEEYSVPLHFAARVYL